MAENYKDFCSFMTRVAENQLDMHRDTYYPICVSRHTHITHTSHIPSNLTMHFLINCALNIQKESYVKITNCYKDPRQTNEETDACANIHREVMQKLQSKLTTSLMKQCDWLETCTDTCKGETDMPCLNKCGSKYVGQLR